MKYLATLGLMRLLVASNLPLTVILCPDNQGWRSKETRFVQFPADPALRRPLRSVCTMSRQKDTMHVAKTAE